MGKNQRSLFEIRWRYTDTCMFGKRLKIVLQLTSEEEYTASVVCPLIKLRWYNSVKELTTLTKGDVRKRVIEICEEFYINKREDTKESCTAEFVQHSTFLILKNQSGQFLNSVP